MKPLQFSMALLKPGCLGAPLKFILATTAAMWMGSAAAHWAPISMRQGQDLRFRDFFTPGSGSNEPEISDRLRQAQGKNVRLVGYMLPRESARPGSFLLTAQPCAAGDLLGSRNNRQAPAAVRVELDAAHLDWTVPQLHGLVEVSGVLEVGQHTDADGHFAWAKLQLLPESPLHGTADALEGYLHSASRRRT